MIYQTFIQQAQVLAYSDIFSYCAIMAFLVTPLALFFSSTKAKGGGGAAHA